MDGGKPAQNRQDDTLIWGLAWERALEPVEELRGRIDLVIVR